MPRRLEVSGEQTKRIEKLCRDFDGYLNFFERLNLFSGPSVYFHHRTLELLGRCDSAAVAARDTTFAEFLYATLTSWGLHRMGKTKAKLVPFHEFTASLRDAEPRIRDIQGCRLLQLTVPELDSVASQVWEVLGRMKLSVAATKLVTNTKALHHLLPALVPPVDRQYTLRFFYGHKNLSRGDERTFREMFPLFHHIGVSCQESITKAVGRGFNTSETKVIDNAIVGFVAKEIAG